MAGYVSENLQSIPSIAHSFRTAGKTDLPQDLFYCAQQHGADVVKVDTDQQTGTIAADAIFTRTTRPIAVVTADCLPILVGSSRDEFVAVIHGGWKGLVAGIIENAFNAFRQSGIALEYLHVGIGPAIQPCCYEVSQSLISHIEQVHGHLWRGRQPPWAVTQLATSESSCFARATATHGHAWLDLPLYCTYLLELVGLESEQINVIDKCTYCSGEELGSYRRRIHFNEPKIFQYSWIQLIASGKPYIY